MISKFREFQIFAKPVGSKCNLNCSYCYYLGKSSLYAGNNKFLMDDQTLEKYIIQHIESSADQFISFSWHGGEPLLAGIGFYKKVIKIQSLHNPDGKVILNGIQTNGTLINDAWGKFFEENKFIVGISLDGPPEFHNFHRKSNDGSGTWEKVVNGFRILMDHGIIPEILCVVNSQNVKHPELVYNFIRESGAMYISFLPLVIQETAAESCVSEDSVPALEFGYFLSKIFDKWVGEDIGTIKIQIFEEAARTAFRQDHTLCIFKENCGGVPVIEHNGDFYSCDHFVNKEHLLGNIKDHSIAYFLDSERQGIFGKAKSITLPDYCIECGVKSMCNGECPKNRFIHSPDGQPGLNYLCQGYKYFFNHCVPFIEAIKLEYEKSNKI